MYSIFLQIPRGHLWLVGDNPENSTDSRSYGPVPVGLVRGKVCYKVLFSQCDFVYISSRAMAIHCEFTAYNQAVYTIFDTDITFSIVGTFCFISLMFIHFHICRCFFFHIIQHNYYTAYRQTALTNKDTYKHTEDSQILSTTSYKYLQKQFLLEHLNSLIINRYKHLDCTYT